MGRGVLTERVNAIAKERIGREISKEELRLIPYIQYVMVNEQRLDIGRVNSLEREILAKWRTEDFIEGGASGLMITKEFWDFMCEILFEAYVLGGAED